MSESDNFVKRNALQLIVFVFMAGVSSSTVGMLVSDIAAIELKHKEDIEQIKKDHKEDLDTLYHRINATNKDVDSVDDRLREVEICH